MDLALIQDGYLPAIIPPILRMDYVSLLERAHQDDGDFTEFIAERELESPERDPAAVPDPVSPKRNRIHRG